MGTRGGDEEKEDPVATGLSLGSTGGRAPVQPKAVVRGAPPETESGPWRCGFFFPPTLTWPTLSVGMHVAHAKVRVSAPFTRAAPT